MRRHAEISTPADVFVDPIVQLAALCPICALAALRPEAAIAALAPSLVLFNPALNPAAALLSFALSPIRVRRGRPRGVHHVAHHGSRQGEDGRIVVRTEGVVVRPEGGNWVFSTLPRA